MPDGFIRLRVGEARPAYGQATAQSGTLQIQSSPAPVATLYDMCGNAVAGWTNVACAHDVGPMANPRVWVVVDTVSPTALAAGYYTLVFKFTCAGSDSLTRVYEPAIEVQVMSVRA